MHIVVAAFLLGLTLGGLLRGHVGRHDNAVNRSHPVAGRAVGAVAADVTEKNGVPGGFAQSEDGAVAAAATFVTNGQQLLDMDPLAAEEAIRQMSAAPTADAQATELLAKLSAARAALAQGTGPIVYRQSAIAWRLEGYTPQRARVAIWSVSVLSRSGIATPQAGWAVSTLDLVWERRDWRIWSEAISPGPAPILDDSAAPATSAELDAALTGFTDFGASR